MSFSYFCFIFFFFNDTATTEIYTLSLHDALPISSVERVFDILDTPPTITDKAGAVTLQDFHDRIDFEAVSFRYPESEDDVLSDITLTVSKGEMVAFVGMSGAGKTTLMDLVPRFHDVKAGRISLDGRDLRDLSVASLRAVMSIVTQE